MTNPKAAPAPNKVAMPGLHDAGERLSADIQRAGIALANLGSSRDPVLAGRLARLVDAVATEATRTQRFARALSKALDEPLVSNETSARRGSGRGSNRRKPGVIDPFAVFADSGESGLEERLMTLDLEQLRDIVAEHGMDHDRLAMKWKDRQRVITRVVERVAARTAKGSAFRGRPSEDTHR